MPRTPKIVEDRREQIIDAALRVFAQKGFSRATNRDVAREAGITTGLIYYYFENKDALLRAILETRTPVQLLTQMPSEVLEQPPQVFIPFLLGQALTFVETERFIGLIRIMLPEALHDPHIGPIAMGFLQRVTDFLGNYLQVQMKKGNIRADLNLELAPQLLVNSVMGFVLRRQIMSDPALQRFTHAEFIQVLTETFLQGMLPD
jgi:AcrR family transcriptional regulator